MSIIKKTTSRPPREHESLSKKLDFIEQLDPKRDAGLDLTLVEGLRRWLRGEVKERPEMPAVGKTAKARMPSAKDLRAKIRSWAEALPYRPEPEPAAKVPRRRGVGDQPSQPEVDRLFDYRSPLENARIYGGAVRAKMAHDALIVASAEAEHLLKE